MYPAIDETLERRWVSRIEALGVYRDPVRSSHGHFVKAKGLRRVSLMLLAPVSWARRVWALPFLTVPAPYNILGFCGCSHDGGVGLYSKFHVI